MRVNGPRTKPWVLPWRRRSAWKSVRMPCADEELGQGGRFGAGVLAEELADDLIELAAVDEVAAAQVPDEPFAGPEVRSHHWRRRPLCLRGECAAHNPAPCPRANRNAGRRRFDPLPAGGTATARGVWRFHSCRKDGTQKRGCQREGPDLRSSERGRPARMMQAGRPRSRLGRYHGRRKGVRAEPPPRRWPRRLPKKPILRFRYIFTIMLAH